SQGARPEEEAVDLRAARLAQAADGRGHRRVGAAREGSHQADPAAARRPAEERAGRSPVRAPGLPGPPRRSALATRAVTPYGDFTRRFRGLRSGSKRTRPEASSLDRKSVV